MEQTPRLNRIKDRPLARRGYVNKKEGVKKSMNGNDIIIKEIVAMTKNHDVMIRELKASNESFKSLLSGQTEEVRDTKRMLKGQADEMRDTKRMITDHERWLRNHEVRLRTQYKMIRK